MTQAIRLNGVTSKWLSIDLTLAWYGFEPW